MTLVVALFFYEKMVITKTRGDVKEESRKIMAIFGVA